MKSSPSLTKYKFSHVAQTSSLNSDFDIPLVRSSNAFIHSMQESSVEKAQTIKSPVFGQYGHQIPHKIGTGAWELCDIANEQFVTSAFSELSFDDGLSIEAPNFQRANHNGVLDQDILLEKRYANYACNSLFSSPISQGKQNDSNLVSLPSNGFDQHIFEVNNREKLKFPKHGPMVEHETHTWQPLTQQMNPPKFLSSLSAPYVEVSIVPAQQQYVQYPLPQMYSQELGQSCTPLFYIGEENLTHENSNATDRQPSLDIKQSYDDMSLQESPKFFNAHDGLSRVSICSSSALTESKSCSDGAQGVCGRSSSHLFARGQDIFYPTWQAPSTQCFDAIQYFGEVGKQKFPEKILVRTNGLNSVQRINIDSVGKNNPPKHHKSGGGVLVDSHLQLNAHFPSAGLLQHEGRSFWDQFISCKCGRHDSTKLLPQENDFVKELKGRTYCLAVDQHGCRMLQKKLTEGTAEEVQKIFLETINHITELMTHPFGNYLVQKLLLVCDEDQMVQFVHAVTMRAGELVRISCNKHGSRVVQMMIKSIKSTRQVFKIVSSLKAGVVTLMKDRNGCHVARHCLVCLMPEHIEFLFEATFAHCIELAIDCHGCCVLKVCLDVTKGEQRRRLISQITSNALLLSQDSFGNYVVQHLLQLEIPWATAEVLKQLEGNYSSLSKQKFSSNVVEKCLQNAREEHLSCIIQEFIESSQLCQVMLDQFGNFVIQTALNRSKGALHVALVEAIRPHIPALQASSYGNKILSSHGFKKKRSVIFSH